MVTDLNEPDPPSEGCTGCEAKVPVMNDEPMTPDPDAAPGSGEYKYTAPTGQGERPYYSMRRIPAPPPDANYDAALYLVLKDIKVTTEDGECEEVESGCDPKTSCKHTLTITFECHYVYHSFDSENHPPPDPTTITVPSMGLKTVPESRSATMSETPAVRQAGEPTDDIITLEWEWAIVIESEPGCDGLDELTIAWGYNFEPEATGGTGPGGPDWVVNRPSSAGLDLETALKFECEPCDGQSPD